ncbi:MAG: AbrB/MazE/SpoVT family DNA-binding domain-containing protein [Nanoarchaeota archaeon]|nr:AbrB/MazE/SpoVT family DNA-binding domain-containing protein [Nanoarchaeota archaeon]
MAKEKIRKDTWQARHTCTHCEIPMEKKKIIIEGIEIRGWECSKCKETVLHSEDAQKMLFLNKLKRGIKVKIGELGQSLIIRFPKEVVDFYKIKKGEDLTLRAEDMKRIELVPA